MFAYCGNNPICRSDKEGDLWQQVAVGLLVQYASDVLGNYLDGKTGLELFTPTSSLAEYTAAAVTAVIPGNGLMSALVRSAVSEGIEWVDNCLSGNSGKNKLGKSVVNVMLGSTIDYSMGKFLDSVEDTITNVDITSYSRRYVDNGSCSTLQQINKSMRYASKFRKAANFVYSNCINIFASYLF